MSIRWAIAVASIAMTATVALAGWDAHVEEPDVFGNTKAIASNPQMRDSLVVQCDQKEQLLLAYLMRKKPFDDVPEGLAQLLVQVDSGSPVTFEAAFGDWNNDYGAVAVSGRTANIVSVLREIARAKKKINIGIVINGNQQSASFSASGSKRAIERVIKACKLDEIDKPSQPS